MADPEIEAVARHIGFDAAVSRRAAVIQWQLRVDDVRNEVGAPHRETAHRIGFQIVARLEVIIGAGKTVGELRRDN